MLKLELQKYLRREYPQENARCEWKEYKNLKNSFCGDEKNDVISYISAIANMGGGHLVIGVKDKTLEIVGTDISVMSEKVCKILLVLSPMLGFPKHGEICDVDISLPFYLIFHSQKYGSRLAYVPSVFSLATDPKR